MKAAIPVSAFLIFSHFSGFSQEVLRPGRNDFQVAKSATVNLRDITIDYQPVLQHLEMPVPGSHSYRARLLQIKAESRKRFPVKKANDVGCAAPLAAPAPVIGRNFIGNPYNFSVPNDNNLSVSNEDHVLSVKNTNIYAWDAVGDSLLFPVKSLAAFAAPLGFGQSKYDPKSAYDPIHDRFVMVFLNGFVSSSSRIIMAFSETNDLEGNWHLYWVSGNPFSDTTWSDYPAIALTGDELFITVNQLKDGQSWQLGFTQSLIWQVDLAGAYAGDSIIDTRLWSNINYGGKPIRNLNPIKGGSAPQGPNMYFLSNRNFDVLNDSIFIVEVTGTINDPNASLRIDMRKSNQAYGVPPQARQANGHEFDTNDGRILGGFLQSNRIQFVGNTIDTATGFAAVYHGFIDDVSGNPQVTANIIGDTVMDFGYPNIAFAGKQACDFESIINFNHTAPTVFSGNSAIYYSNDNAYSNIIPLKTGDNYVDILAGPGDRWGDYSGSQRKFNEPGKVWVSASWGSLNQRNQTWITELTSPDSISGFPVAEAIQRPTCPGKCDGAATVTPSGNGPYTYSWDASTGSQTTATATGLCAGTYSVTVTDQQSCTVYQVTAMPDTMKLLVIDSINASNYNACNGAVAVGITGGTLPYSYAWNDPNSQTTNTAGNLCPGTYTVTVTDKNGCSLVAGASITEPEPVEALFPNPVSDLMTVNLVLETDMILDFSIYDDRGRLVAHLLQDKAKPGRNIFTFSTVPLAKGAYVLRITSPEVTLLSRKFIKQ